MTRSGLTIASFVTALLALQACTIEGEIAPEADSAKAHLIFGNDDRLDHYQVTDQALLDIGSSIVALVDDNLLYRNGNGTYSAYRTYTLAQSQNVCSNEPFATQQTKSFCSGFQVGTDLIATAGHCINSSNCNGTSFIFDFKMDGPNNLDNSYSANDVYQCSSIVGRSNTSTQDWAVVRVDRDIVGHDPLAIRRSGTVSTGTPLVLIGHPNGLPIKYAGDATVRSSSSSSYFQSNLDAFGGNSGSAVFNANTLEVEGILVRGFEDYSWTGQCFVSTVCPNNGCPGFEQSTRTTLFDHLVPAVPTGPTCADDNYEPNDSAATAVALTAGTYRNLEVCASDADWFAIDLVSGQSLDVSIAFSHSAGDLDLQLVDDNDAEITVSESTDDDEAISVTAAYTGTHYLHVYGYQGAATDYDLDVAIGGSAMSLGGLPTVAAGNFYTWEISGAPVNQRVRLAVGNPNGTTPVNNCSTTLDVGVFQQVGNTFADAVGHAEITVQVPGSVNPGTYTFQAYTNSPTCDKSGTFQLTVQ